MPRHHPNKKIAQKPKQPDNSYERKHQGPIFLTPPSESPKEDEVKFDAMKVPLRNPSEYTLLTAWTTPTSFTTAFKLHQDGPFFLPPCIPKASQIQTRRRVLEWPLNTGYDHWAGAYCIWFMPGEGDFYVLRKRRTVKRDGRLFVEYESVRPLSREVANPGIDQWFRDIAAWLVREEGCLRVE